MLVVCFQLGSVTEVVLAQAWQDKGRDTWLAEKLAVELGGKQQHWQGAVAEAYKAW